MSHIDVIGQQILEAVFMLFLSPFYYVSLLLIMLQFRRQLFLERKLFRNRLSSVTKQSLTVILWGTLLGIGISSVFVLLGVYITTELMMTVWITTIAAMLFRFRFICIAYVAGFIGILQVIWKWIPQASQIEWLQFIHDIHFPSLLIMVGVLHIMESLLLRFRSLRMELPAVVTGKRGKLIGAYQLQAFWPLPLFMFVPSEGGIQGLSLDWTTFFSSGSGQEGWMLTAFPILLGYSTWSLTQLPQQKAKQSSTWLLLYAFMVCGVAVLITFVPVLTILGALLCIVGHECIVWANKKKEENGVPFFTNGKQGLRVLAVIPDSPAAQLGIAAGETVYKVNGYMIETSEQLHKALRMNAAFCKLEIKDHHGESKFLQRAVFDGEHHQLGMILCPDDNVNYVMQMKQHAIWSYIQMRLSGWKQRHIHEDDTKQKTM
ncbi:PDZ domain-containing protein [Longirhabdus pacifica]|uniref:PDZ domain-containing protein n=1 Tax=Longirhabdus pacifica TaxID=2305227 RepID=UPI001008880A|nr:PDZ domain-containing protein [Longirhabdus pacifica]